MNFNCNVILTNHTNHMYWHMHSCMFLTFFSDPQQQQQQQDKKNLLKLNFQPQLVDRIDSGVY